MSSEKNLEQEVEAALERMAAAFESLDKMKAALREGKRLPVSGEPIDWQSLKARIEALMTPDEDIRRLLENEIRLREQDAQRVAKLESD